MRKGLAGLLAAGGITAAALQGCATQKQIDDSYQRGMQTGYKIGNQGGIEKGREEQYNLMNRPTANTLIGRNYETGQLEYGRLDLNFNGNSYENYKSGKQSIPDVIIMSDLRGIAESSGILDKVSRKPYLDMLWRGQVPAVLITTEEGKKKLDEDEEFQRTLEQYLPPFSYAVKIVSKEEFSTTDPWEHIKDGTYKMGNYVPAKIRPIKLGGLDFLFQNNPLRITNFPENKD